MHSFQLPQYESPVLLYRGFQTKILVSGYQYETELTSFIIVPFVFLTCKRTELNPDPDQDDIVGIGDSHVHRLDLRPPSHLEPVR